MYNTRLTDSHIGSHLFPLSCDHYVQDTPLSVPHIFNCPALAPLRITHRIPSPYTKILTDNNLRTTNILSSIAFNLPLLIRQASSSLCCWTLVKLKLKKIKKTVNPENLFFFTPSLREQKSTKCFPCPFRCEMMYLFTRLFRPSIHEIWLADLWGVFEILWNYLWIMKLPTFLSLARSFWKWW